MDRRRLPLLKRLQPAHWVGIDALVTVVMALTYTVVFRDMALLRGPHWVDSAIVAVAVLPAAFRRRGPRTVLALVVAGAAVITAISTSPHPPLVIAFVIYLIPIRSSRREAVKLLAASLLALTAGFVAFVATRTSSQVGDAASSLLLGALLISVAWMVGYTVHQQRRYAAGLLEQAERRASEELAEERRTVNEERLQIARELHDVVAHTMSLIAVQAGVAHYVVNDRPQEAARALASIQQTSRAALPEMRALLGILRAEGHQPVTAQEDLGLVPAPGLADLHSLVERTAKAGLQVDLDIRGQRPALSPGLDLAAYRVIQEAITNVIKHAATNRCRVVVGYQADSLTLEVSDEGSGGEAVGRSSPTCHGIVGMRERVVMYGGQFQAMPLPGRGFRVTARFPLGGPTV